jgi:sterol desaturase/sphingolipid hydroxylase (fatty acid hydroxylase superfamily)
LDPRFEPIRTPYWLGFIFQRPESHQTGHHRHNYSDLPIWDLLFGTFDDPRDNPPSCGFSGTRETQLTRMLLGKSPR